MGIAEISEIVLKIGFGAFMCCMGAWFILKLFYRSSKREEADIKDNETATKEFFKEKKMQAEMIMKDKQEASELLTREREELKQRLSVCETDLKGCNLYIRDKLTVLLEENIELLSHVNNSIDRMGESIIAQQNSITDLQKAIGKIKEIRI